MSDLDHELERFDDASDVSTEQAPALVDDASADRPARQRRFDKGLLVACFVIASGVALIAWGLASAITGDDGIDRPEAIEDLSPVENALQAFEQQQIVVDLEFGYEAVLVIDGIELPTERIGEFSGDLSPDSAGQQVSTPPTAVFDPGNAIISFRPTDGAPIESFDEGRHQVQVIFWKLDEGREAALSYRWSFDVT